MTLKILLLLLYGSILVTGQSSGAKCATYCTDNTLSLENGTTLEYLYSGWVETTLSPHSSRPADHDASSGLLLNATVLIKNVSPCEISLELKEVQFSGESKGASYADLLTREPVRASIQGGRIEAVCAPSADSPGHRWALNVKKSILGAFQLPLVALDAAEVISLHEVDVSGVCRTQYQAQSLGNSTLVTKTKDLTQCSGRNGDLDLEQPRVRSSSSHLLRGNQHCIQTLSEGRLLFSHCKESHVFQPFSTNNGTDGVTTSVHQTLTLENVIRDDFSVESLPLVYSRSSLLFDHGDNEDILENVVKQDEAMMEAKTVLHQLSGEDSSVKIKTDSAKLFANLVRVVRKLDEENLKVLVTNEEIGDVKRSFIMDILPTLDNQAGIALMSTLYTERAKQIPKVKLWLESNAASWFASLANSRKVESASIKPLQKLLVYSLMGYAAEPDVSSIVLGITGLARKYCENTGDLDTCELRIYDIVSTLEQVFMPEFHASEKFRIIALKGLGNIGAIYNREALKSIILNETLSIDERLAAIDSFRRFPCSKLDNMITTVFLNVFADASQDSEIRIAAYLSTVRCPTPTIVRAIKRTLYSETVNQVGSFVWTHLTNSQESSGKGRQVLRNILANEFLQNKFNTDARQFSRNYEGSHYFQSLGVGTNIDANIIFSTKSYLPRSAMLNLTVDLFGESINLLEVGGRAEGFEPMIEQLFAKKGAFENEALENFLKNARKDEQYDSIRNMTAPMKRISKPKASGFLRFNGQEVSYVELEDVLQNAYRFNLHPADLLRNLISKKELEFQKSAEFLKIKREVPTLIGLPLKLDLLGTSSVTFKIKGHYERTNAGFELSGLLKPSASVALTGTMSVGEDDFEQGVRVEATLFTQTSLDNQLIVTNEGKVNFLAQVPEEKQTLIDLRTERLIFNGNQVKKLPDLVGKRENSSFCSGEWVDNLLGLKFCSELSFPNTTVEDKAPAFPLNGDSQLLITLEKTDPRFKAYEFSSSFTHVPGKKYDYSISLDRLGSELRNKRRSITLVYDKEAGVAIAAFDLPEKQAGISILWDSKELSAAELVVSYDRVNYVDILAKLDHQKKMMHNTKEQFGKIEPEIKFKIKGLPEFHLKGIINYSGKSKLTADLNVSGLTEKPISLAVDYNTEVQFGGVNARVSVDSQYITWDVKANAKISPNSLGLRVNGFYNLTSDVHHTLEIMTKCNWNQQGALKRGFLNLKSQLSQWPQYSGQLQTDVMTSKGYYESNMRLTLKDEEWNVTQRFQATSGVDVWIKQTVECPQRTINFLLEHRHKYVPNIFSTTTQLRVDSARNTNFHLDYKYIPGDGITFSAESALVWPKFTFSNGAGPHLQSRIRQTLPGEYDVFLITQWKESRPPVKINAVYKDKSSLKKINHYLNGTLTGAFGFVEHHALGVQGKFMAVSHSSNIEGRVTVGGDKKCELSVQYEVNTLGKKSLASKLSVWQSLEVKKDYEINGTYYKSVDETALSMDLLMSRHLSFNFKKSDDSDLASIFWDKANDTNKNVTLLIEYPKTNEISMNLLVPGQNISVSGYLRYLSSTSKNDDSIQLNGHTIGAKVSWLPGRDIYLTGSYKGNFDLGAEVLAELRTKNLPVVGSQLRVLEGEYVPSQDKKGGKLTVKHAWRNNVGKLENFEARFLIEKKQSSVSLEFFLLSTLWDPKIVSGKLNNSFQNWSKFNGDISAYCGDEGVSFSWDWSLNQGAMIEIASNWTRIASTKLELKYNVPYEIYPGATQNWVLLRIKDNVWKVNINYKKQKTLALGEYVFELSIATPMQEFEMHAISASLKWKNKDIDCNGKILTPLIGDYAFNFSNRHEVSTNRLKSILTLFNKDDKVTNLEILTTYAPISKGLSAEIMLEMPDILNIKSEVEVEVLQTRGAKAKINFFNNDELLHDFTLGYGHERLGEEIKFHLDFSGFSYMLMPSRWKLKANHEGTKSNHTSNLEINKMVLDHNFVYNNQDQSWSFDLKGSADKKEILKINMLHHSLLDCKHYLTVTGTNVFDITSRAEQGFLNMNFMNKALQILTRISDGDEIQTTTRILANNKLYATAVTSTYLRYKEGESGLESAIISIAIDSDSNNANIQVNVDSWRRLTTNVKLKYEMHKAVLDVDVLSPNNTIGMSYWREDVALFALGAFVHYSLPSAAVGLDIYEGPFKLKIEGEGTMDEDMMVYATAKVDMNQDNYDIFPIEMDAQWQLPKDEQLKTGGRVFITSPSNANVKLFGHVDYGENSKNLNATLLFTSVQGDSYSEHKYEVLITHDSLEKQYLFASYRYDEEKVEIEMMLTEMMLEIKLITPITNYKYLSLKAGVTEKAEIEKQFLEYVKDEYVLNAELIFKNDGPRSQVAGFAKSNNGFEVEAAMNKILTDKSTDIALEVLLNKQSRVEAGAFLQFQPGEMNISANMTRDGKTQKMQSLITNTADKKIFGIKAEFMERVYEMQIYSTVTGEVGYEQGYRLATQGLESEFHYEKTESGAAAHLKYQEQHLECKLNGSSRAGSIHLTQKSGKLGSQISFDYNFEGKIDAELKAQFNEKIIENIENQIEGIPLFVKGTIDPKNGVIHFSFNRREIRYLFEGMFVKTGEEITIYGAISTPHFEAIRLNASYDIESTQKSINMHLVYGRDFYDLKSDVSMDGSYSLNLNMDAKSSVPDYETMVIQGSFSNNEKFTGTLQMIFPSDTYKLELEYFKEDTCRLKIETDKNEYVINYVKKADDSNFIEYFRNQRQLFNATVTLANETLLTTIMTPHEKYNNLTFYVKYGSNVPSKNLVVHKNNEIVFKAQMYPIDQDDFTGGTGITATIFQGDQKFVYDAQFSVDNPIFIVLKQHEAENVTRDILHFSLNVTDENSASGKAEILLPISPNTKLQAKGQIQIENKNAEFKMSYKFDEEEENNFAIHYLTYTDNYNIYNIETNLTTPFKGYESMALKINSSWTETVVKFTSQLPSYENIVLIAVHRLEGPQKELWIQYQNMKKSVLYVKALFFNEANNKRIELKTQTPFLNGQALASNNGTVMEIMLEHEEITLCQIISKFEEIQKGNLYEFTFKKPEKVFKLKSSLTRDLSTDYVFNAQIDDELMANIDFHLDALGSFNSIVTINETQYEMNGGLNWLEKSIHFVVKSQDGFQANVSFELLRTGFLKISSTKMEHDINVGWIFSDSVTNFNISRGEILRMDFGANENCVDFMYNRAGRQYSFSFGQTRPTGWPNILLKVVWDNEDLVDFLHDYLTDSHLLIVRTRLTSPFLGSHKNMKFSLTLKTRDVIEIEAEFKWRPKDVTLFTAALQMERLASTASVSFVSPFSTNFTFNAQYDFSGLEKEFEIVYVLGNVVSLQGRIIPTGIDQSVSVKLQTPIQGYSTVELTAFHKIIGKSQRAEMQFTRETEKRSIEIFFDDHNMKALVITPDMRWSMTATYVKSQGVHSVEGNLKWSGSSEALKFEGRYKPQEKLFLSFAIPESEKYTLDYTLVWLKEKKTVDLLIQKGNDITELSGSLSTQENLNVFVAFLKSPWFKYVKISAILDTKSNELGGAIQIEEDAFSMKASQVVENAYKIKLFDGQEEKLELEVSFEGEVREALKVFINCVSQNYKFSADSVITSNDLKLQVSSTIAWGDSETIFLSVKNGDKTEIEGSFNTQHVKDSDIYLSFGSNFMTAIMRNQSETYKGSIKYELEETYSLNGTLEINGRAYEVLTYYDPRQITLQAVYAWPQERRIDAAIVLKPGDISITLKTPYVQFQNIQINGKYSEQMTHNDYQLASKADAKWNDFLISLSGVIKSSNNNYGLDGRLIWDNSSEIKLKFGVVDNKVLNFELRTPFRGLPYFSAQLEALKHRHIVSGISGVLKTPFDKLPMLQFTFNRGNDLIEMKFTFDTSTYRNISIHTKLKSKNGKYLFMHINTPFVSRVKYFEVEATSSRLIGKNGQETKISLHLDENEYAIENNYTIVDQRLDSYVYMRGPSNKEQPIVINFGGRFEMVSMENFDLETYFNEALLGFKCKSTKDLHLRGRIHLSSLIPIPKTDFTLNIVRSSHFEGKIDYNYGTFVGNALIKNKLENDSLETKLYLNLPQILKYPLQVEMTANYNQPRLQFNGFASFMAEHRLELIMVQTSFRTTLNAHLDSAFFKGKNKFELILSTGSLSVSINDEIKITGLKKANQLKLTLGQISKGQDHTITYNWDLSKPPTFDVTLESPILASKRATFSATYLGALKGINIKLVSGSESLKLDYDVINKKSSKGLKLVIGNSQAQLLNLAVYFDQIPNGQKILAELNLFEIDYKAVFQYSLPVQSTNPKLYSNLFLSLPYLFPIKLLTMNLNTGKEADGYFIKSDISMDKEMINLDGKMTNETIKLDLLSSFPEVKSLSLSGRYMKESEKQIVDTVLIVNDEETLKANVSLIRLPNGVILQVESRSKIKNLEHLSMKLTIPSEIRYSLTAHIELRGTTHFDGQLTLSSRPGYSNFEINVTGLSVNMYLTPNQGFFGYKTQYDDYSVKIYSKSSGHQLDSEVTVNSGNIQLFKTGLFGMYHNHTDFYILMSTNCIYETLPDTVLYMGAKKSEIKFGTEFDYKFGDKRSYTVVLNHFIESSTDFDIGITLDSSGKESFIAKITHVMKDDFYIALAQVNKDIIKISKINQNSAIVLTGTIHCGDFESELSGKLMNEIESKGVDLKITWNGDLYQAGGSYNYSENQFIIVKFNLNSPPTGQYTGILEYSELQNLYILFDRDQSPLLLIELSSEKVRSKYVLFNATSIKFMLSEYHNNNSYELLASALYDKKTIQLQYDSDTFPESPDSYRINATIVTPERAIGITTEKYLSENHNISQSFISWESLDRRVGYLIDITKDNFKANLKTSIEIPNRAIDLKTHYKYMEIPEEATDFEFGVQFNWNSKIRLVPITFITTVKLDHEQKIAYHYTVLAHPSFNSSYVIDGKMTKPNLYDNFFNVKMGPVENGKMTPALIIKLNATRKASSSQYFLALEHPQTAIHQQWDLNVDYENGLAARLSLLRGITHGFSSINFGYNSASTKLEIGLIHNELSADVLGQLIVDRLSKKYGIHASASFDALMPPITLTTIFEKPEISSLLLTAELNVAPERAYIGQAKFTPYHISALLAAQEYDTTQTALQAAVTLNTTDTISFVANYKTSIWANITQDLIGPFEHAKIVTAEITSGLQSIFKDEVFARFAAIIKSGAARTAYQTIVEHTTAEINSFRQDWASFRQQVMQIYKRDVFYIKTITDFILEAFRQASSHALAKVGQAFYEFFTETMPSFLATIYKNSVEPIVSAVQKFSPTFNKFIRKVSSTWNEIQGGASSVIRASVSYMQEGVKRISEHTNENIGSVTNWAVETKQWIMNDYFDPAKTDLVEVANALEKFFRETNEFIVAIPKEIEIYLTSLEEVQEGIKIYKQYAVWLEEFRFAVFVTELKQQLQYWYEYFLNDLQECIGEHAQIVPKVINAIKGSYDELMEMPSVVYIRIVFAKIKAKTTYLWEVWEMKQVLQELMIRSADEIVAFVHKISASSDDYRKGILIKEEEYNFNYDPVNGEISGSVTLPITWKRFDQIPSMSEDANEKFQNFRLSLLDQAYEMATMGDLQDAVWRTILPPFRTNALITVNGHVITFDGNHYKIKNMLCGSYILAADYVDNTFAIVASYGHEEGKLAGQLSYLTLYTQTGNKVTIEVTQTTSRTDVDGQSKIYVNGSRVELPLAVDDFEVTRQGPKVVALSEKGIGLHCNIVNGVCSLDLSGWYHAKVAGIAGSFDKEQRNDFAKPDGKVLDSVVEFLSEWKVSGSDECEMPAKTKVRPSDAGAAVCAQLFSKSSSVLQPCFSRLDPEPFRVMCEQDATDGVVSEKGPDCLAAEAYVEQCRFVGMDMSLPAYCSRCRLPGKSIAAGDVVVFDSSPKSRSPPPPQIADFVFLVERGSEPNCLQGEHLFDLPAKIDSVLRSTLGINSTKFALASFGAGKSLTVHTLDGNIWSGRRGIQNALSSLSLEKSKSAASNEDLHQALFAVASKLHYRAGASKNLILVPCTSCDRSEKTADVFSEASSGLVLTDIRLHVLQSNEMIFKRTITKKTKQGKVNPVMGVDSHGAYTGRRHKGTSLPLASKAIMRQLSLPKDLCTPLAMETNGTVFSASRLFNKGASDEKRKWLDVWSRRVASSARPTPCQTCDCVPLPDGSTRLSCTSCMMPEIEIFLDEWERALEEALQEDLDEDYGSVEVPDVSAALSELESEREALNKLRGTIFPGNTFSSDIV